MAQKLLICGLSLLFHMTITKTLPVEYNIDENFRATASWPVRVFYLYLSLMAARPKYYFAWTLGKYGKNSPVLSFIWDAVQTMLWKETVPSWGLMKTSIDVNIARHCQRYWMMSLSCGTKPINHSTMHSVVTVWRMRSRNTEQMYVKREGFWRAILF